MRFQMYRLNRIKFLILILLCIAFIPNVKALVKPTERFYINDYADILSSDVEDYIFNKSVALDNVDGTQIVVVTVKDLEKMSLEDYATKLFREFGIGDKKKNNGLLLLLAYNERKFRVEVGYGLEGILPDGKTGRFQDQYIIPYLKNDDWDNGVKNGYDAFYKEIVTLNNLDVDYSEPISNEKINNDSNDSDTSSLFIILFFPLLFIGDLIGTKIKKLKNKKNFYTIIYLVIWTIFFTIILNIIKPLLLFNLIAFLSARFASGILSGGYRSLNRGGASHGGFSGRGGSSGGGGSSRGF